MRPAYDLTDPDDAYRFLEEDENVRWVPPGREPHAFDRLAVIASWLRWPRADGQQTRPTGDEALAALTLLAWLRSWLAEVEPQLIDAARAQKVTWEQLARVLNVGDRRAAQRRAARLSHAARLARLPADHRPPPDVAKYDDLLPSRRPSAGRLPDP